MAKDYYEILGVSKDATQDDIKKAYRTLVKKYPPDLHPNDPQCAEKFKEINEANEVLSDDQKRAAYDRFGHQAFANGAGGMGGGNPFGNGFGFNFDFGGGSGGFSDIFSEVFGEFMGGGRGKRQSYAQKGQDVRYNLSITLEEAFSGLEKEITLPSSETCEKCHGHGTKDGKEAPICPHCNGSGKIRMQQGFFVVEQGCPHCKGSGRLVKDACSECKGKGFINKHRLARF